jgi:hypothetical protein
MTTLDEAQKVILDRIVQLGPHVLTSDGVLRLAEAYAWVVSPAQPHGGSTPAS